MKNRIISFLLLAGILISCTGPRVGTTEIYFIDALGNEVGFSDLPDRIVIAGKQTPMLANFAYLFDGAPDKVVAIENRSQSSNAFLSLIDPGFVNKLTIEKGAGAEQISPSQPEAVLLKTTMKEQIGDQLDTIGIPPVYVSLETIDEIYRDIRVFGSLMDEPQKAEDIIGFYNRSKESIDTMVSTVKRFPRVLLLQIDQSEGGFAYKVPASSWLQTVMVDELHADPVWKEDTVGGGWMEVNLEQIISWQPEVVIVINYQGKSPEIIQRLGKDSVWQEFVQNNSVDIKPFGYDFQSWDQPDPRWILGYVNLAHLLHPETVHSDVVINLVREFYKELYGLELDFVDAEIIPLILPQLG